MTITTAPRSVPLEDFIQAVQAQLDTAQARMTLKAQNDKLPLTFAIRDITMDLKAHVEMGSSEVRIRPAGPNENDASVLHLQFTAITKPMIDETAVQLATEDATDTQLEDLGDSLDADERRRLEWIGVRTVAQLDDMQKRGLGRSIGRITNLPIGKLESVLSHAARPMVDDVRAEPVESGDTGQSDLRARLRVRGRNMLKDGNPPVVAIGGRPVGVLRASDNELLLDADGEQFAGQMSLAHDHHASTQLWFDESARAGPPRPLNGIFNEGGLQ
ncbi:MAG: hypothetical protein Q7T68_04165 [Sphingopyxis sp.]|nr:hypothetical protein [Sphingopyxis sp.]